MKPMTRKNLHVGFLDHIRGFAILYVFVFHCLGAAYKMDQLPWSGWLRGWGVPGSFLAFLPRVHAPHLPALPLRQAGPAARPSGFTS